MERERFLVGSMVENCETLRIASAEVLQFVSAVLRAALAVYGEA